MAARTKVMLSMAVKEFVASLTPAKLNLSNAFKVEFVGEFNHKMLIKIKDPVEIAPRHFEITIREKI